MMDSSYDRAKLFEEAPIEVIQLTKVNGLDTAVLYYAGIFFVFEEFQ